MYLALGDSNDEDSSSQALRECRQEASSDWTTGSISQVGEVEECGQWEEVGD